MSLYLAEISSLAHVLHENGDKILNGFSKLSINAALLYKINSEFNQIVTEDRIQESSTFEVLSPHPSQSKALDHLAFLHDFFQKTGGLKLVNNANLLAPSAQVDLSKFKKLKYLELRRVPIKQLIGLKVIQHQVECIICERGLSALEHLLAECGGDQSTGFVWSELKEAVFSFNDIKIVDSSVAFAPRLQVLDLSHNQIVDVNAIERLPNLKYVNLSYNSLSVIPAFNKSAKKKIEVLVLKNNYIENLNALLGLESLTELDLSNNLICCSKEFHPFLSMPLLHWLSIQGNPVSVVPKYRLNVVKNLHISASFGNFVLDGISLTKKEKEFVGMELMTQIPINSLCAPALASAPADVVAAEISEKPRKKSGKIRLAVIPNLDGTYEELSPEVQDINLSDHLATKRLIESARHEYGDNWLRCEAAEVVKDILGLPQVSMSSTPYDDTCLAAILDQVESKSNATVASNVITTTAVIEPVPRSPEGCKSKNNVDSFLSCNDEDTTTYISLISSKETIDEPKETSPDIETIDDPNEEGEVSQETLFLVVRLKYEGSQIQREELFLSMSDTELRELDITNGRAVGSWSLASLESATRTRDCEVHLVFDTIRRDRRERVYELESVEVTALYDACRGVLEGRTLSDMKQVPFRCVTCSATFIVEQKLRTQELEPKCPVCGSKVVLQVDEVPSPGTYLGKKELSPRTGGKSAHSRSASVGLVTRTENSPLPMPKRSSHSSIGSAASLDDQNLPLPPPMLTVAARRCDSDIEILSNPSQSSIEVIDAPTRLVENEEESNEKLSVPNLTAAGAFTALTESSSSGSVTDSICTQYENSSSMVSSGASKKSGLETSTLIEESSADDDFPKHSVASDEFQTLFHDVLQKVGDKMQRPVKTGLDKDVDAVEYSYTTFRDLDHRIKLYVYAHLFKDYAEECLFLLRCQILTTSDEICYDACVVCSNTKLYVLKVTGKEEGEEASKFLQKVDSLCFNLGSLRSWGILPWNQGFTVTCRSGYEKTMEFLILMKDMERTLNFVSYVSHYENLFPTDFEWKWKADEGPNLRLTQFLLTTASDPTLLAFACIRCCRIGQDDKLQNVPDGAIVVTSTDLYIVDTLKWMFTSIQENLPVPVSSQELSDLMKVEVRENVLRLHFLREAKGQREVWSLTLLSGSVIGFLLSAIKSPWEELFSVPLQIATNDTF